MSQDPRTPPPPPSGGYTHLKTVLKFAITRMIGSAAYRQGRVYNYPGAIRFLD